MTWLAVSTLALVVFALLVFALKVPRSGWPLPAATLMLGLAGYAVQASPDVAGAPRAAAQRMTPDPEALMSARNLLDDSDIPPSNRWIVIADAMARNGQFANAAQVLLGALDEDPGNAMAWLALGNALVGHADGLLTPAALHAYDRAASAAPDSAGPPYFLGLAYAQSGRFAEARAIWAQLLAQAPAGAPWRALLAERLARLDLLIEAGSRQQAGR